jgi:hypothetical protein
MIQVLEGQRKAFRKKFDRDPRPEDPVFFDPLADEPRFFFEAQVNEIQQQICAAMQQAGIDPAIIYAYIRTRRPAGS